MMNQAADPAAARRAQTGREREVWADNLKDEVRNMSDLAETYSCVAIEAHVPTRVARPTGPFGSYLEYNYSMMKCNVDLNHALNISFSLSDARGQRPKGVSTWRFNFLFDPQKDFFAQGFLEKMYGSGRLNQHVSQGIKYEDFGELLLGTGMVLTEETSYIAFSCESGLSESSRARGQGNSSLCDPPERRFNGLYCFSYLLRILMSQELPNDPQSFFEALDLYFPCRFDLFEQRQVLQHLSQCDQQDPLRRPLFCFAPSCLEAYHWLPEEAKRAPKRPELEAPPDASRANRRPNRRRSKENEEKPTTNGTVVNGHGNHGNGVAPVAEAKTSEPNWQ